jgi:uncharacterized DUF497 family protein
MRFEWDAAKSDSNQKKHGIDFETAQFVFDDPRCVTFVERVTDCEERCTLSVLLKTSRSSSSYTRTVQVATTR